MFDANALARPNIRELKPYSSARDEFTGKAEIFLDANENSLGSPAGLALNRYPDPLQRELKTALTGLYNVSAESIFVGNGSDEAIDLLMRVFCTPGADEIIICPPTYGMYRVAADVNDVTVRDVPLNDDFGLDVEKIVESIKPSTKLIFICSPNNPTGNAADRERVLRIVGRANSLVVVDEAYGDFYEGSTLIDAIAEHPNLVVLRTLSKAYGLAAARVGLAFADASVISLLNRAKPPYNVNGLSQQAALDALRERNAVGQRVVQIRRERERLREQLGRLRAVDTVFPSDANFLLVRFANASTTYHELLRRGIVVRDRSREYGCSNCLRITVGTRAENERLLGALEDISNDSALI